MPVGAAGLGVLFAAGVADRPSTLSTADVRGVPAVTSSPNQLVQAAEPEPAASGQGGRVDAQQAMQLHQPAQDAAAEQEALTAGQGQAHGNPFLQPDEIVLSKPAGGSLQKAASAGSQQS